MSSEFHGPVTLVDSVFDKSMDLRRAVFCGDLDLRCRLPCPVLPGTGRMTVNTTSEMLLPDGWRRREWPAAHSHPADGEDPPNIISLRVLHDLGYVEDDP